MLYGTVVLSVLTVCNVGVLWPNGWMDQDSTWYGDRPRPRRQCVRWEPSSPTERGTAVPTFRLLSIVAKRSPISATAELLFYVYWLLSDASLTSAEFYSSCILRLEPARVLTVATPGQIFTSTHERLKSNYSSETWYVADNVTEKNSNLLLVLRDKHKT